MYVQEYAADAAQLSLHWFDLDDEYEHDGIDVLFAGGYAQVISVVHRR